MIEENGNKEKIKKPVEKDSNKVFKELKNERKFKQKTEEVRKTRRFTISS